MTDINTEKLFDSDGDNTAQAARTSGGYLDFFEVVNPNTTQAFLQLFDLAAADVTVGTTTPNLVFMIPPGNGTTSGQRSEVFYHPVHFRTALTYACTTTATGNGDPTTGLTVSIGHH